MIKERTKQNIESEAFGLFNVLIALLLHGSDKKEIRKVIRKLSDLKDELENIKH